MVSDFVPTGRPDPSYTKDSLARRVLNLRDSLEAVEDYLYTVMADPTTPPTVVALASAWLQQIDDPEGLYTGPSHVFSHAEQILDVSRRRQSR